MRELLFVSLVTFVLGAPHNFNYQDTPRVPHLEYGPAPTTSLDFFKDLQSVMAFQTGNIGTGESYSSNSIEQYTETPQPQYSLSVLSEKHYPLSGDIHGTNFENAPIESEVVHQMKQQPIISKRFYLHSAPEEDDEEISHKHITVGKPRKNINVVFIRAPIKAAQRTSLKIRPAINEDRTIIYVLAKKQDAHDIDAHVLEPATTTAKPEVYFIKYKTNEEAEHAQSVIQSQYNELGGSTQISNEGIAPVSSVIGLLDPENYALDNEAQYVTSDAAQHLQQSQQTDGELINVHSYQSQSQTEQSEEDVGTNNGYLPPTLRKY